MAIFLNDTFTDADGTALEAHTGETGATWSKPSAWGGSAALINGGRVISSGVSVYQSSGNPSNSNYSVASNIVCISGDGFAGPAGRIDSGANNFYYVEFSVSGIVLRKIVAGASSALGSFPMTVRAGNTYSVLLSMVGSVISVVLDGVTVISAGDTSITSAGKGGLVMAGSSPSTGLQMDSIQASDLAPSYNVFGVFDGDSLTYGQNATLPGGTVGTSYPARTIALLGRAAGALSLGAPGQQITQMMANAPSFIDPTYIQARDLDVLVMLGGTNDCALVDASTVQARLSAYWNSRRTATPGRLLVACTLPPAGGTFVQTYPDFPARRLAVNAWLRGNYKAIGCDRLADIAAHPLLQNPNDMRYFAADNEHLTNEGYSAMAAVVYQAISGVRVGQGVNGSGILSLQ